MMIKVEGPPGPSKPLPAGEHCCQTTALLSRAPRHRSMKGRAWTVVLNPVPVV